MILRRTKKRTAAPTQRAVELQPHRRGYEFVRCGDRFGQSLGCGWVQEAPSGGAAAMLRNHIGECAIDAKDLYVPMWSISWPYYHDEREVAYREGDGSGAPYGLEMSWRPAGTHSLRWGLASTSEKAWWLFPELGDEEGATT